MRQPHTHHSVGHGTCPDCLAREAELRETRAVLQELVVVIGEDPGEQSRLKEQWKWASKMEKVLEKAKNLGIE